MEYADLVATVVDTSRSEIISDCIRYVKENVDEDDIWEDYGDKLKALAEEEETEETEDLEEEED